MFEEGRHQEQLIAASPFCRTMRSTMLIAMAMALASAMEWSVEITTGINRQTFDSKKQEKVVIIDVRSRAKYEQARRTRSLYLNRHNLRAVPSDVFKFCGSILRLDIGHNMLTCVPDEVSALTALEELWLNDNPHLTAVSPALQRCKKLKVRSPRTHARTHTQTHAQTHAQTHTHTHIHKHTHTHTYTYITHHPHIGQ